jgi:hypothetical protein
MTLVEDAEDWRTLADHVTRAVTKICEIPERQDRGLLETPRPAACAALDGVSAWAPVTPARAVTAAARTTTSPQDTPSRCETRNASTAPSAAMCDATEARRPA